MTTDPVGVITDVNDQMCALTGRKREELITTPFTSATLLTTVRQVIIS